MFESQTKCYSLEFYNRFAGRQALLAYAAEKQIPVQQTAAKPWSTDENLFHISYEAGILEDPDTTPPDDMWKLTSSPENAPTTPERISVEFKAGIPVKVTQESGKEVTDAVDVFMTLNALARKHGIGRIDIVENRFIGVKSRGCYESPAATILRVAHMDLEGLTLDRNVRALRDQFVTIELSRILYNGHWFTPEREFVTSSIPASQRTVNGVVRLKLYKGSVSVTGRRSPQSLYSERHVTFEDDAGAYDQKDAEGFIKLNALRLRLLARRNGAEHAGG